jgi:hypothetical protein
MLRLRSPTTLRGICRAYHGPERQMQTGIGPGAVQRVRLRCRGAGETGERIGSTSAISPRWARRTPSLDALLAILHLHGISMGDCQEALGNLLGKDAPNWWKRIVYRSRMLSESFGGCPYRSSPRIKIGPTFRHFVRLRHKVEPAVIICLSEERRSARLGRRFTRPSATSLSMAKWLAC